MVTNNKLRNRKDGTKIWKLEDTGNGEGILRAAN